MTKHYFCFVTEKAVFVKKTFEILVSEYSELSKTSRNVILASVRMYLCVRAYASDFQRLKPR